MSRRMKPAPFRAWLVTGPAGRFTGFVIEFSAALINLARSRFRN